MVEVLSIKTIPLPLILSPWSVFIIGVFLHMNRSQSLGLIYIGSLLLLVEHLPLGAESLTNLRVVHLGVLLGHLSPLRSRPHHEGVHWPFNALQIGSAEDRLATEAVSASVTASMVVSGDDDASWAHHSRSHSADVLSASTATTRSYRRVVW